MPALLVFTLTGLVAQFVDGALGMGFGVTSSTVLVTYGVAPAVASASIQLANVGTGVASGLSHHRFGNVSWPLVAKLGVPGAIGGFSGATVLSSLSGDWIVPAVAVVLLGLGTVVLVRSARGDLTRRPEAQERTDGGLRRRFLTPLGLVGGFLNAIGGGGWGPVATPAIMASGRVEPRHVIGSVSAAEVMVTLAASVGFFFGLSGDGLEISLVLAMMAGGVAAAPFAAYVTGRMPPAKLGVWVGTFLLVLNSRTVLVELGAPPALTVTVLAAIATAGLVVSRRTSRTTQLEPGSCGAGGSQKVERSTFQAESSRTI